MTFGQFLQAVVCQLHSAHGWTEHANALLYTQGAPALIDCILESYQAGRTVETTAARADDKLNLR